MDFLSLLEKYWKVVLGGFAVIIVGGGIVAIAMNQATAKEKKAQEAYFAVEKKLTELKAKKASPENKEAVDFAAVKKDLEGVVSTYSGSIAAQMAALHLANLLSDEKNFEAALGVLRKVEAKDTGLINTLVMQQIGQLLADSDKCTDAITAWDKILARPESEYAHGDVKIQKALCYVKLKDWKKAEEILTNLANQPTAPNMSQSGVSKEAEKYLRLVQFKKASGS